MTLSDDVNLEEFVMTKEEFSGADIKAICTEAGLLALRERRMKVRQRWPKAHVNLSCKLLGVWQFQSSTSSVFCFSLQVTHIDFKKAKEKVMYKKKEGVPEGLYM